MARETIAQKNAKAAAEKAEQFAKLQTEYPKRLMKLMAEYSNLHNFSFKVHETQDADAELTFMFNVYKESGWENEYVLSADLQDWNMMYELESAERAVADHYEREAESQRKYQVLQNAKAKLQTNFSKEELELLGLK